MSRLILSKSRESVLLIICLHNFRVVTSVAATQPLFSTIALSKQDEQKIVTKVQLPSPSPDPSVTIESTLSSHNITNSDTNQQQTDFSPDFNSIYYKVVRDTREYDQTVGEFIRRCSATENVFKDLNLQTLFDPGPDNQSLDFDDFLKKRVKTTRDVIQLQSNLLKSAITECPENPNITKFFAALDSRACSLFDDKSRELSQRPANLEPLHELFAISCLWLELGLSTKFNNLLIRKLLNLERDLDKVALLHLMITLHHVREFDRNHKIHALSSTLVSFLSVQNQRDAQEGDNFTFDQLGLIGSTLLRIFTQMPFALIVEFTSLASKLLKAKVDQFVLQDKSPSDMDLVPLISILKAICFSLHSNELDPKCIATSAQSLVHSIESLPGLPSPLNTNTTLLTQLVRLLDFCDMHYAKRRFKSTFDRLVEDFSSFSLRDITQLMDTFANVQFMCPNQKLKALEQYIHSSDESKQYPSFVYHITYSLLSLNFFPSDLIKLCTSEEYRDNALKIVSGVTGSRKLHYLMLAIDAILRMETSKQSLLTSEQVHEFSREVLTYSPMDSTSIKSRFLVNIHRLLTQKAPHPEYHMIYLFPFSIYPIPVLLNPKLAEEVPGSTDNLDFKQFAIPFQMDFLKPNYFEGCTALLIVRVTDKNSDSLLRGSALLHLRMLDRLGFRVLHLNTKEYFPFTSLNQLDIESTEYVRCEQLILGSIVGSKFTKAFTKQVGDETLPW